MNVPHTVLWIAGAILALIALTLFLRHQRAAAIGAAIAALGSIVLALVPGPERPAAPISPSPPPPKPVAAIVPDTTATAAARDTSSTTILLGGVTLRVAPSDHYVLAVDGRRFLILDTRGAEGMVASCDVGNTRGGIQVRLLRNRAFHAPGALKRPDNHTLLVQDAGVDLMRISLTGARRIEVRGRFYPLGRSTQVVVSDEGIEWPGGTAKAGRTIDLRRSGKGTIDFGSDGKVRVMRQRKRAAA